MNSAKPNLLVNVKLTLPIWQVKAAHHLLTIAFDHNRSYEDEKSVRE